LFDGILDILLFADRKGALFVNETLERICLKDSDIIYDSRNSTFRLAQLREFLVIVPLGR